MRRKHSLRPTVQCLEGRQLLSVVVAERENNNKASRANVFSFDADGIVQIQGTAANRQDRDFFRFTAAQSGPLGLSVRTRNGVFAQLEIEQASGVGLFETQPKNGINSGTVSLVAGQTYLVRLRSPINGPAAYTAELSLGGASSPPSAAPTPVTIVRESRRDDQPRKANAVSLVNNEVVQLKGTVSRTDRDYFSIIPALTGTLNISTRTTNGVLAKLEIEDATGRSLFETEPNDGRTAGSIDVVAGQSLSLRVRSAIAGSVAAYEVDLHFSDAPGSGGGIGGGQGGGSPGSSGVDTEPNDTKGGANVFGFSVTGTAQLSGTAEPDGRDYFKFTPDRSGTLFATVGSSNNIFAALEVESANDEKVLETEPNDGVNTANGTVVAGRTYFVRLKPQGINAAAYVVDLVIGDAPPTGGGGGGGGNGGGGGGGGGTPAGGTFNEVESNGDVASGTRFTVATGQPAELNGTSTSKDDRDFFVFTAATSGTVSLLLSSLVGPLANVEVENAASVNLLELQDGLTNGTFAVTAGATYSIRLRAPRSAAANYRLVASLA